VVIVDVIAGVLVAVAMIAGLRFGLARLLPLIGFAAGAVLGSRMPLLFGTGLDGDFSLVAALPGALIVGAIVAAIVERFGWPLTRFSRTRPVLNTVSGAFVTGAAAIVMVWLLAPVVAEVSSTRDELARSEVLAQLNSVLKPAGPDRNKELPQIDNFPRFAGELPVIAQGEADIVNDPDVVRADESIVKIRVNSCRYSATGSGWIGADGIVVTNAHVASQALAMTVQLAGEGPLLPAIPIWFDPRDDVALLRVDRLKGVAVLPIVHAVRPGTAAATLGFPLGRHVTRRARIGPTTDRLRGMMRGDMPSTFPRDLGGRLVTTFRGRTDPGSSGGPVVDTEGRVLTMTFGGGGYATSLGVPIPFIRKALRSAGSRRVGVGACRSARASAVS
jgi:S1-C subfamily serine protease